MILREPGPIRPRDRAGVSRCHSGARASANPESISPGVIVVRWIPGLAFGHPGMTGHSGSRRRVAPRDDEELFEILNRNLSKLVMAGLVPMFEYLSGHIPGQPQRYADQHQAADQKHRQFCNPKQTRIREAVYPFGSSRGPTANQAPNSSPQTHRCCFLGTHGVISLTSLDSLSFFLMRARLSQRRSRVSISVATVVGFQSETHPLSTGFPPLIQTTHDDRAGSPLRRCGRARR